MLLVLLKAGVLNTLVAVCHAGHEALRSCCPRPCFHTMCLHMDSSESWMPPWSYCMPRIKCLDEHKGASLSCKSICFLSCAEIIPEHHLTAPEGPLEQRQLETCCGNRWHWIAPKPLFKSFFGMNWDWVVDWKSNSLAVASSAGSASFAVPAPVPHRRKGGSCQNVHKFTASSYTTKEPVHQPVPNLSLYILLYITFLICKEIKKCLSRCSFPN